MATEERVYLIRVAGVLDRSTAAAAGDFVQQFERANRTRERQAKDSATRVAKAQKDTSEDAIKQAQRANEAATKEFEKHAARREAMEAAARQRKVREDQKEFDRRLKLSQDEARRKERERREEERDIERTAERARRREEVVAKQALNERKQRVRQMANDVYQDMAAMGSKALGVGKEIAGGFGVNFDVSSGIAKAVQLQKMAVGIVNAGNRGGGSAAERDAEAVRLQQQARDIGNKYAFDPTKMLAGYAQFQAKTGDTVTASAGLERFAKLAKAFNVELDDMISAAGEISSKLEASFEPGEARAKKTYEILKLLTAQGQEGAVEIADLAKETARLGGGAGFFKGDIGTTIGHLGALAQLARQTGGANSSADSARAVAAFVTTLKTPARRDAFKKHGVEFTDAEGSFLDPLTIIKNALRATNGDTEAMNEMFKSSLGTKPVDALAKEYKAGGGGAGGLEAVDRLWAKFTRTASEDVIGENAQRAMGTTESKAQLFQNKLDAITASLAERVLPAFEKLAPKAEQVMNAFADLVTYVSNHSGQAITLALVGSIAKAAIGPAISKALVDTIAGKLTGAGGVGGDGVVGAGLDKNRRVLGMQAGTAGSVLGSAMTIGAIAVTTFTVGSMVVDKMVEAGAEADTGHLEDELRVEESDTILKGVARTGQISEADKTKLAENIAQLQERINLAKSEDGQLIPGTFGAMLRAGENYVTGGGPSLQKMEQAQKDIPQLAQLEAQLASQKADFAKIMSGTITVKGTVTVDNMPAGGMSSDGRTGVSDG